MDTVSTTKHPPIAIIGMGSFFPGSTDPTGFWRDILAGTDHITDVPENYWLTEDFYDPDPFAIDKTYAKRGAFLESVTFDPMFFGTPPSLVPSTDTAQLLALMVARQVLDDAAKGPLGQQKREKMSCILGVAAGLELLGEMSSRLQRPIWVKAMREHGMPEDEVQKLCDDISNHIVPWTEASFPGLLGNVVAGRIANRFDLGGMNCTTDAACASSFSAMALAIDELYLGHSDVVITGGVDAAQDAFLFMCFSKTPALSLTGDVRPFSDAADGTMLGEGLGMVALKRLEDAQRDGDKIYGVIRGLGAASDGRGTSVYAPLPEGQARALRRCYEVAGVSPATIELVEAHGTGTKAGDVAEVQGLRSVFDDTRDDKRWCALGSIKSQIGHTKSAAAAAGLIKTVLALHHKTVPPTIKVDRPNPKLSLDESAFYLNTEATPWVRNSEHPRRAGVSSFGFGGTNFHCVVEEYLGDNRADRRRTSPTELVMFSGESVAAVVATIKALHADLGVDTRLLKYLAQSTQASFDAGHQARLTIVAKSDADLRSKLDQALKRLDAPNDPTDAFILPSVAFGYGAMQGKMAYLCAGQGSQYVGMGKDLAMFFDSAASIWDACADINACGTTPLHQVVFPHSAFSSDERDQQTKQLTQTQWAQPALGAVSAAMIEVLKQAGLQADCFGGHSFGEVTALYAAGAFDLDSFIRVARCRGELMAKASEQPGAMLAVTAPKKAVASVLAKQDTDVVIANHNSPTQVVVSGPTSSIEQIATVLQDEGINTQRLPVATAFHSPVVSGACAPFAQFLGNIPIDSLAKPVYANSEAAPYQGDAASIRAQLSGAVGKPVRFVEEIEAMYDAGVRTFVEIGPGSVLSGLTKQCLKDKPDAVTIVSTDRKGRSGLTSLWQCLGVLAANGAPVDVAALWQGFETFVDPRTVKKPMVALEISGVNYNRSYPPKGGAAGLPKPNSARKPSNAEHNVSSPSAPAVSAATTVVAPSSPATPMAPPQPIAHTAQVAMPKPQAQLGPSAESATPAWLNAYQQLQQQTVDAHGTYQQLMADAHLAFLKTAEASTQGLFALATGQSLPKESIIELLPQPTDVAATREPQAYASQPAAVPVSTANMPVTPMAPPSPVVSPAALPVPEVIAPKVNPLADVDLKEMLFTVVAEKTGYPEEILNLEMSLEGDLGIDSIKRVEILSAIQEKAPSLPEVDAAEMAALTTLAEVLSFMEKYRDALDSSESALGSASPTQVAPGHVPEAMGEQMQAFMDADLQEMLFTVVAEKTGYPEEILNLEMSLEGDLGIDSIKRVEILSAFQERAPELPEVDAAQMAALQTLGQVLAYIEDIRTAVKNGTPISSLQQALPAPEQNMASKSSEQAVPPSNGNCVRLEVIQVEQPASGFGMPGLVQGAKVAITRDAGAVADALKAVFCANGFSADIVQEVPKDTDAVVFLGALIDPHEANAHDLAFAAMGDAFGVAKTVAPVFTKRGGVFVTVQDTDGTFGLHGLNEDDPRLLSTGLTGIVKSARLEWPKASVKAIDVAQEKRSPQEIANIIYDEMLQGGPEIEVGFGSDGLRMGIDVMTTDTEHEPQEATSPILDEQSVLVVSGGARGVTAETVVAVCARYKSRVVLLGRTALEDEPSVCLDAADGAAINRCLIDAAKQEGKPIEPKVLGATSRRILANREIKQTIERIQAAGGEARYFNVSVTDEAALVRTLTEVRKTWGPISGIIHGAGVLHDKLIADKPPEHFQDVLDTKVNGLRALLLATASDPLKWIGLFSSVAARYGNIGQSDYAAANEILNRIAASLAKARPHCVVRAINWGPWAGGMVTPALKEHLHKMGVPMIALQKGGDLLADEITRGGAAEVVIEAIQSDGQRFADPGRLPLRLGVSVGADSHPYLSAHRIDGVPVVPVVLVLEWFSRAAQAGYQGLSAVSCRDLQVLRGIRLPHFNESPMPLVITRHTVADNGKRVMNMELTDTSGTVYYRAVVELKKRNGEIVPTLALLDGLKPWPWTSKDIYGKQLFHETDFQVIQSLEGVSDTGGTATLQGVQTMGWPGQGWQTDVAILDGGLQLGILWGSHVTGKSSLPTHVGEYVSYTDGLVKGPVQCVLTGRQVSQNHTELDVRFATSDGKLVAEMLGVQMHALPN